MGLRMNPGQTKNTFHCAFFFFFETHHNSSAWSKVVIFQGLFDKSIRQARRPWEPRENGTAGLHGLRTHSRTEQVLLWDDTDQSSKQMLVCPTLRGNAGWKWSFETRSKGSNDLSGWKPSSKPRLHRISLGKDRTQKNLCDCLYN